MLNIGGPELLVILLVALVVLGPDRLPGAARQVGRTVNQLRSMAQGFQQELEAAAKPDLSPQAAKTDTEHVRTAAKASGAQVFGGAGVDEPVSTDIKPVSDGGPQANLADETAASVQNPVVGNVPEAEPAVDESTAGEEE